MIIMICRDLDLRADRCPLSILCRQSIAGKYSAVESQRQLNRKEGVNMSRKEMYETQTETLILPILEKNQFELVDVEYVKEGGTWYLRAYIDKEGGITVNDCELVAREMNEILDREDYIEDSYIFEVSSPGLGRPLKKEKDYARSMGKELEIRTYRAIDKKKEFYGILTDYDEKKVTIQTEEGEILTFAKTEIALIRLAFDF